MGVPLNIHQTYNRTTTLSLFFPWTIRLLPNRSPFLSEVLNSHRIQRLDQRHLLRAVCYNLTWTCLKMRGFLNMVSSLNQANKGTEPQQHDKFTWPFSPNGHRPSLTSPELRFLFASLGLLPFALLTIKQLTSCRKA